jgi:dienelactone hydrolase
MDLPLRDKENPPQLAQISFESKGQRLNGSFYIAAGPELKPTVILLHGIAGNERILDVAQALRRAGVNVL